MLIIYRAYRRPYSVTRADRCEVVGLDCDWQPYFGTVQNQSHVNESVWMVPGTYEE